MRLLILFFVLSAVLMAPGAARADVRAVTVVDGLDHQDPTPSLVPRPPEQELVSAAATYDREAGQVAVSASFNVVADGASFDLAGKDTCRAAELGRYAGANLDATPMLSVAVDAGDEASRPTVSASLEGYGGSIGGTSQLAGTSISASVAHPAFAGRDYRCIVGIAGGRRVDDFFAYFDGFAPRPVGRPRLICNAYDEGPVRVASVEPRSCSIWREGWSHAQSASFIRATWRGWGRAVAHARATLTYNMGYRRRVSVRAYRLRPDCTGWRWVYTRVAVRIGGRSSVLRPDTCPTG